MKIKSLEEFDTYICGIIRDRMKDNIETLQAMGINEAEIADAMPTLVEQANAARSEMLTRVQAFMSGNDQEPPSFSVN